MGFIHLRYSQKCGVPPTIQDIILREAGNRATDCILHPQSGKRGTVVREEQYLRGKIPLRTSKHSPYQTTRVYAGGLVQCCHGTRDRNRQHHQASWGGRIVEIARRLRHGKWPKNVARSASGWTKIHSNAKRTTFPMKGPRHKRHLNSRCTPLHSPQHLDPGKKLEKRSGIGRNR